MKYPLRARLQRAALITSGGVLFSLLIFGMAVRGVVFKVMGRYKYRPSGF